MSAGADTVEYFIAILMKISKTATSTGVRGVLKRGDTFILRIKVKGKQIWRTLSSKNLRDAAAEAKRLRKTMIDGGEEAVKTTAKRSQWPKLSHLVEIYKREGKAKMLRGDRISLETLNKNVRCLERITGGSLEVSSAELTKENLVEFSDNWLSGYESDAVKLNRRRNSIIALHRRSRSLFADWAMNAYEKAGISLPSCVLEWKKTKPATAPSGKYRVPLDHPDLVATTLKTGVQLSGELGLAWVLCFEMALRTGEAKSVCLDWFNPAGNGHYRVDVITRPDQQFKVKGSDRQIAVHRDTFQKIQVLMAEVDHSGPYVLPGLPTQRFDIVGRDLAAWMRDLGWKPEVFEKCAHELRKLQGSRWFSDPRLGPAVAQEWLGHADVSTTCKFYAALASNPEPLPPAGLDG